MPYREEVEAASEDAAAKIDRLDPGDMATLRRMTADNPAPVFWKIAVRHSVMTHPDRLAAWVEILRILAILTPRGAPETRPRPLHRPGRKHHLGAALCDGGDPAWRGPRPVMSERRLAQLLATRGPARTEALVRAARLIASTRDPRAGFDVHSIAWAVLNPGNTNAIAEAYYRRLDHVGGKTEETTE
jgi:CRISPR system Cascade subunit CasB